MSDNIFFCLDTSMTTTYIKDICLLYSKCQSPERLHNQLIINYEPPSYNKYATSFLNPMIKDNTRISYH